jgi:hypothetical protein
MVEGGNDSPRLLAFTAAATNVALLPFAVGLGVETSIAGVVIIVPAAGIVLGCLARRSHSRCGVARNGCGVSACGAKAAR